jgi:multiple sugar transport system permease protein
MTLGDISVGKVGFVEQHGLWSDEQRQAASRLGAQIEEQGLRIVRIAWGDQHGIVRGKNLMAHDFLLALRNSFAISIIATVLAVIVATLAAYAIARLEFKGKRLVLSLALAIAMFPVVSLVGPLFDMWRTFHLFNTWPGLIIPYMTFTLPLAIWTLSAFFREIPWEMEQAAQVDGATSWQAFRKVIVPLAAPGVFTAAILTFFFAWNEFVLAISLTSTTAARTVPAQMSFFVGPDPFNPPYSQLATASVIVTIPVIVIVLLFQRRIVAGLTSGAVKG